MVHVWNYKYVKMTVMGIMNVDVYKCVGINVVIINVYIYDVC